MQIPIKSWKREKKEKITTISLPLLRKTQEGAQQDVRELNENMPFVFVTKSVG